MMRCTCLISAESWLTHFRNKESIHSISAARAEKYMKWAVMNYSYPQISCSIEFFLRVIYHWSPTRLSRACFPSAVYQIANYQSPVAVRHINLYNPPLKPIDYRLFQDCLMKRWQGTDKRNQAEVGMTRREWWGTVGCTDRFWMTQGKIAAAWIWVTDEAEGERARLRQRKMHVHKFEWLLRNKRGRIR